MRTRRVLAGLATAVLAAGLLTAGAVHRAPRAEASPATPGARDVIVHLFQWPWASVANECRTVLGPRGFGGVQVSPPQEHVVRPGYPWWQDYQPVSYQLTSRRGDRAGFAAMVGTCHAAGVKIYVDAVVNHMAGGASTGAGSGGSTYSQYAYPAVPYGNGDFHHCGRNGNDDIVNWGDRWEVQNCELVDLSDLRTESAYVRGKLTAYLNDLVSLGVDGFRVDAAKHLPAADLAAIVDPVTGDPYVFSEVIEGGAGEPAPEEYAGIGDVTEFRYGDVVGNAFRDGNLSGLNSLASQMRLGSGDAVAFVDNHDTQRNGSISYHDGAAHDLAVITMLAAPYGVPALMSSYGFDRAKGKDRGPPSDADGVTQGPYGAQDCATERVPEPGQWVCEHRRPYVSGLVALRRAAEASSAPLTDFWSDGSHAFAFAREGVGFVAVNAGNAPLRRTFTTRLPQGSYCDVAQGRGPADACLTPPVAVDEHGFATLEVGPEKAVVLFGRAK
jgi:alpha-amylase